MSTSPHSKRGGRWSPLALAAVLSCGLSASFNSQAENDENERLFQREDVFGLEFANQPQWSPDGEQILYQRHFMDIMEDRVRSNLWLIDVDSGSQQALTTGARNDGSARWAPDGKSIAYIGRDAQNRPQIMRRWLDTGREAQLTQGAQGPSGISWSPDGRWIAFARFVPSSGPSLIKPLKAPKGANWADPPKVVDRPVFRADGRGFLPHGQTHLFVISAEGGSARQLTQGNFPHDGNPQWSADGQSLYFSGRRFENWEYEPQNSELYRLDINSLEVTQLTERYGPDRSPQLSPDGKTIAWLGFDDKHMGYTNTELYIRKLGSDDIQLLSGDLDRNIDAYEWSADGRSLIIKYDDNGNGKLARLNRSGKLSAIADNVGGTSLGRPYGGGSFAVSDKGAVVYTQSNPQRPSDLQLVNGRGKARSLTQLNEDLLAHKQLGRVEEVRYPSSFDGREIQGWLVYPPNYEEGKKYPLILEIHGGPFANYGDRFSAEYQLFTAAGYIVLYTNPRGSTSYGAEFANLIHHRYPSEDYDDLISGVDLVLQRGLTSEDQLYVTGGSGGGVLTSWIIGKTDRFQAAVVAKPVINWTSFVLNSDFTTFFYRYWFDSPPWENQANYWQRSPLSLVGNVSTPTMVLTGEADYRTPISESEQYYQALKLRKIDSVLVRVPGAPHFISGRPSQLIAKTDYILSWFERYPETDETE